MPRRHDTLSGLERLAIIEAGAGDQLPAFARDVKGGLTAQPKRLPCRYFYDREGSLLFEAICELPEYYLTRAEREILEVHAAELASQFPAEVTLIELGSGNAAKTRILIETFLRHHHRLRYVPVDICRPMLEDSARTLLQDYPALDIIAVAGEYHQGLHHFSVQVDGDGPKLILWLGSSVGNLDRPEAAEFLRRVQETMSPRDRLLLGVDVRKDRDILEQAYDDTQGITARFNRNILARINRELGGNFDLNTFRHRVIYNETAGRIEMYLVSTCAQLVQIDHMKLTVRFAADEAIHTENSYKYATSEIEMLATGAGLHIKCQWLDADRRFSLNLCERNHARAYNAQGHR